MKLEDEIRMSRKILQNPYAYLDGDGGFDAISSRKPMNVHEARRHLQNQYAYLDENGGYSEYPNNNDSEPSKIPLIAIEKVNPAKKEGRRYQRNVIENIARTLQKEMWIIRKDLIPSRAELGPKEILDPSLALQTLGYNTVIQESLGQYSRNGELFEVAGIIDNSNKEVQISRRFSPIIRNFTTAHKLGHAVLHGGSELHRDHALDGTPNNCSREPKEAEADVFAAYFLLPEKQVNTAFKKVFLEAPFTLNDDTAFALGLDVELIQNRLRTLRDLSRFLASAERYNGIHLVSMAKQFNVSVEAMAIRLEELGLVQM